jgi:hypothetical protein
MLKTKTTRKTRTKTKTKTKTNRIRRTKRHQHKQKGGDENDEDEEQTQKRKYAQEIADAVKSSIESADVTVKYESSEPYIDIAMYTPTSSLCFYGAIYPFPSMLSSEPIIQIGGISEFSIKPCGDGKLLNMTTEVKQQQRLILCLC